MTVSYTHLPDALHASLDATNVPVEVYHNLIEAVHEDIGILHRYMRCLLYTSKYPGAEGDVLEHISFTAKPGQTTAVIGSTGCGKSTLIQLIPRFYDVTEGKITLDGVDIRNLSQHKLREVMGLVPQKGVLFSGTIASNIKLAGEDEISDETMKEAAQTAQATEFIDAKPEGYDSPVAQGGSNVSGGQKQRLAIARVIAKHPKVYLFDDSFSALDYKTDAALRKALHEQAADATVLIVAQKMCIRDRKTARYAAFVCRRA